MPALIKHLKSLCKAGVFAEYSQTADTPDFKRLNLIYGFNGSGKTTLSRVFRSIEIGKKSPQLAAAAEFAVSFVDAPDITHDRLASGPHPHILVFNEDFVEENLRWRDGKASPVYFIGKEQARLAKFVDQLVARLTRRQRARDRAYSKVTDVENRLAIFKRERARTIAEELNLGRRYVATQLEGDYAHIDLSSFHEIEPDKLPTNKALINQVSPANPISQIRKISPELLQYLRRVIQVCGENFSVIVIEELRLHAEMLKWAKDGADYHVMHDLRTCLFCGNEFTEERALALQRSIDDRFDRTIRDIQSLQSIRATSFDDLDKFVQTLPDSGLFDPTLAVKYKVASDKLRSAAASLHKVVTQTRTPLDAKARAPNVVVETSTIDIQQAESAYEELDLALIEANSCIDLHNQKISRFEQEKADAAQAIKIYHLKDGEQQYRDLQGELTRAQEDEAFRSRLVSKLEAFLEKQRSKLRAHDLAVEPINKTLAAYLGHSELTLSTVEEGYQIHRNGRVISGPLSEGEKTALALCYFLSKLEENGRRKEEVIAIVDDPISSLDSKALNYAASLVRLSLASAGQLIILTHNLQFMNEVKKWLKPLARAGDGRIPTASLLFLNVEVAAEGSRRATLQALPRLLRDYDSEYHYLCSLIFRFMDDEAGYHHLSYVLPNVLRKVLELFLNFKNPGPDGLGSKLDHPSVRSCGLDQARIRALHRLADAESHGDNLDDLLMLSPMTIEETRVACSALLELMQIMDAHHFARMKSLCE